MAAENRVERKIISISSMRQVTIPQRYYELLGFGREAECILRDDGIFIRPVKEMQGEFAEQILEELIEEGYSGTELLSKFREKSKKIRPAVESLIAESDEIAADGFCIPIDRLFSSEDD